MGPATCTGLGAISIKMEWVQGPSSLTHTTSNVGTREFMQQWVRVPLYICLFARSIVTRRRGIGGVFLPWGKGLIRVISA